MFWGWHESLFTVGGGKYYVLGTVREYWLQLGFIVLSDTLGTGLPQHNKRGPGTDHWGTASLMWMDNRKSRDDTMHSTYSIQGLHL